ncbi:MAG TPA: hypothetical protein VFZ53_13695 [Polyangiaceae bacterium]
MDEKWTLRFDERAGRVFIIGQGFATEQVSKTAADRFLEVLGSNTVDLVVDVGNVTGYASGARRAWQERFYPVRKQLKRLLIVGSNIPSMVRMAATVVAAVTGVPVRFYTTMAELELSVGRDKTG